MECKMEEDGQPSKSSINYKTVLLKKNDKKEINKEMFFHHIFIKYYG